MSREPKKPSCIAVFLKTWFCTAGLSSAFLAAVVGLGIRYWGWSSAAWTDFSSWNSYPILSMVTISLLSIFLGIAISSFISLASMFLAKGRASKRTTPKARPQSQRKTTV